MASATSKHLTIIGAPSSAGAYGPGQEKAPAALRAAGLSELLAARGITVDDRGDVSGFRWRPDKVNAYAMNVNAALSVARATAERVASALAADAAVLVLGGDCTVELGTVAGALQDTHSIGLIYIDVDTDLNTPVSTRDGALDWMGVAHMLGVEGTVPELAALGPRMPMLEPEQVLFFANDNVRPSERQIIDELGIAEVRLADSVSLSPRLRGNGFLATTDPCEYLSDHCTHAFSTLVSPRAKGTEHERLSRFQRSHPVHRGRFHDQRRRCRNELSTGRSS
jgi:arginase